MCSAHLQLHVFSSCKSIFGIDFLSLSILPTLNYFLMGYTPADDVFVDKASVMDLQDPLGPPTTATLAQLIRTPC